MKLLFGSIGLAGVLVMAFLVSVMAWLFLSAIARSKGSRLQRRLVGLANIGEGRHTTGNITKLTDAAITERYRLAKVGSDANHVAVAGAADLPIGVITDEAAAAEAEVNVFLLGGGQGTILMVASGSISQYDYLEPAANGRVQTKGGGAGTHYVVGRALNAASSAGDLVEVDPLNFIQVI
jgi:hypothetical protein